MDDSSLPTKNCQPLWRVVPEKCSGLLPYSSARELELAGAIFWRSWRIDWAWTPIFARFCRSCWSSWNFEPSKRTVNFIMAAAFCRASLSGPDGDESCTSVRPLGDSNGFLWSKVLCRGTDEFVLERFAPAP